MKTDRKARSSRKTPFVASLALACTLAAGSAGAGIPVTDVGNMPNHIITQISSYTSQFQAYAEYGETLQRWQRTVQEYQDAITKLSQIGNMNKLLMETDMQTRPASYGVEARCPSTSSGGLPTLSDMMSAIGINQNGDILSQQSLICVQIVSLENKKYNELVEMLKKAKDRQDQITEELEKAKSDSTEGNQEAYQAKIQALMGASLSEMQYSQARVNAFDGMIQARTKDQSVLAEIGLKGSPDANKWWGPLVQGATLEIALQALRTRDR
jgi:hypothetical protein